MPSKTISARVLHKCYMHVSDAHEINRLFFHLSTHLFAVVSKKTGKTTTYESENYNLDTFVDCAPPYKHFIKYLMEASGGVGNFVRHRMMEADFFKCKQQKDHRRVHVQGRV